MKKRTTSWNLLDFLLIGVSGTAMANQWQTMTRMLAKVLPQLQLATPPAPLVPGMLAASALALILLLLVLRRFDSLAERLVGTACIWGMWYFTLDTLVSGIVLHALMEVGGFSE